MAFSNYQQNKGDVLNFEDKQSEYSSLDYIILKQVGKVMECANNTHDPAFRIGFINAVEALHQVAQYYWFYDPDYTISLRLLNQWKKQILDDNEGQKRFPVDKPLLFLETKPKIVNDEGDTIEYELDLETEGEVEMTVEELNLLHARLWFCLLMGMITKRQKTRDIEDTI